MEDFQTKTGMKSDKKCNVLEFLEETERKYPDRTAVDDGTFCLSWRELKDLSQRMGTLFCEICDQGEPVVILAEKSARTLAAMFGVVYAGCFYVMVDPSQPAARVREILKILEPQLVVLNNENEMLLDEAGYTKRKYILRDIIEREADIGRLQQIRRQSRGTDLLYGIFTSGSTGTPKGIVVSHQAVIDFITHFVEAFGFHDKDRIGNQAPFDFDVSVKDIYTSISTGATLVLIPKELFSLPSKLLDYLCEKEVTVLIWAVSALSMVTALKGLDYRVPRGVRLIGFSGEVMPVRQLRMWQKALPDTSFVNLYGPTEITCNCTYYPVERMYADGEKLPIGRAFPGRRVFLLDEQEQILQVPGKIGEICVAGESLSEGYYRNPEETKKRFRMIHFSGQKEERCYCTGDLGYYDDEGMLYFSGRKDFQIKHMGHRIELEEIESTLNQVEGVERSCCLMDERRNRLIAFYLGGADPGDVRAYLKKHFPVYMIPHKIQKTEGMPLNKNGKTDRNYFRKKLEVGM